MAVTTVYTNENVGATAEGDKLPNEVNLSSATGFYLVLDLVNEAHIKGFEGIELCYDTHYVALGGGASTAPAQFKDTYRSFRIVPNRLGNTERLVFRSNIILAKGPFLYTWLNVPAMGGIVDATHRVLTI